MTNRDSLYAAMDEEFIALERSMRDNVYFNKLGEVIKKQITQKVLSLTRMVETKKASVAGICKKREVNFDAVLDDPAVKSLFNHEIDEATLYNSSVALSHAVKGVNDAPVALANSVYTDLKAIIKAAREVAAIHDNITHLTRIQTNLNADETYKLFYDDLEKFGF